MHVCVALCETQVKNHFYVDALWSVENSKAILFYSHILLFCLVKLDYELFYVLLKSCLYFQQYLDAAEQDRERYTQEMNAYKQTEAYKIFSQQQAGKKPKEELHDEVKVCMHAF